MNRIIKTIIPQQVRVRKYEVDMDNLKTLLRESKAKAKITNKGIANELNKPLTLIEHWFRNDSSFSIPTDDIWSDLKKLLNIETDEFDKSIMEFEIRDGVFDKSNRVYDSNGIAPTLTCVSAENERYIVYESGGLMNEIKVLGNYSPSNHNASRIISIDGITPTVMENHGTVTAILENKYIGEKSMWRNNLEKFNFKMEEVRVFDIFSGIGSLHKSLKELGVPVRITNLSEVDIDAIISYGGVHIENFKDDHFDFPSDEDMRNWLINRNIGYDFDKNKSKITRLNKDKLKLLYKSSYLLNNLGDVAQINPDDIEDFDLMNLSFCCQDISGAGKQKGLRNEDGTPTRSGLIVPSLKLARSKKPKYIMIENVKALIQKKFIDDFYDIVNELEEMGYNCYYPTKEDKKGIKSPMCLNSKDFGIPQNRERIYVICIRKDIDNGNFEFPIGRDFGIRLKDLLEDNVDEKYYLSPEIQNKISNWNAYQRPFQGVLGENSTSPTITARGAGEYHSGMVLIGDGLEDKTNLESNKHICEQRSDAGLRFFKDDICGTLKTIDTCGDKRVLEDDDKEIKIRKLTPLECWRLMGFDDKDFYKAQELGISDSQLYKQAGNSIVVNVLYYIFKNLFKEYIA